MTGSTCIAVAALLAAFSVACLPSPAAAQTLPEETTIGAGRGLDSLRITRFDGGKDDALAVLRSEAGVSYLDLGDVARLTGEGYVWNPETFRGSIRVDSTDVAFLIDSPLVWVAGRTRQLEAPIRFHDERVLLPFSIVDDVLAPRLGERCRWDAETGRLTLAGPGPWLSVADVQVDPGRLIVRLGPLPDARAARVRHDPGGQLTVELRGVGLPVDFAPPTASGRGLVRVEVSPRSDGLEFRLDLDRNWIGLRSRFTGSDRVLTMELTDRPIDLEGAARFEPLVSFGAPPRRRDEATPRRIVLERGGPSDSSSLGAQVLSALVQELRFTLERDFRYEVDVIGDREAAARVRGRDPGPAPMGDVWIGLRLERYPSSSAREFLVVVPDPPVRWETVAREAVGVDTTLVSNDQEKQARSGFWRRLVSRRGGSPGSLARMRPVPWGQTGRVEAAASQALAQTIADHLRSEMGDRPVRVVGRPARVFRGVASPAVLLYPASRLDESDLESLADPDRIRRTARSLAFGIDEFLLSSQPTP